MKPRRDDVRRIETALIHYHRSAAGGPAGNPSWQQKLMSGVRRESLSGYDLLQNAFPVGPTVCRFALVTCLAVFLMALIVMDSNVNTQYQLAELTLSDAAAVDMARSFGVL